MVGAQSVFATSWVRTVPCGTPGPRTIGGTPIASSYGAPLPSSL
jgi:hypothetical protein